MATSSSQEDPSLVRIQELIRLPDIGVSRKYCTWARVTLTSDKHLCIRHRAKTEDNSQERDQILILNLETGDHQVSLSREVDAAAICPHIEGATTQSSKQRLAYQEGNTLKVICPNSQSEEVLKCSVTGLQYWCWINADLLALITYKNVLHWNVGKDNVPVQVFELDASLSGAEIISYKTDPSLSWLTLTGLVSEADGVSGVTQLYSAKTEISQCIIAHSTLFTTYMPPQNPSPCQLLCTVCRDVDTTNIGKVHIIPLSVENSTCDNSTSALTGLITFPSTSSHYDFPVSLHTLPSAGLLYILTKYGMMFVCDMSTAQCLCRTQVSKEVLFTATLTEGGSGLIAVNRAGQVLQVDLKTKALMRHVQCRLNRPEVAKRLSVMLPSDSQADFPY